MSLKDRMTQRKTNRELFDLTGRVVLITGSAGQLGPEYADGLSEAGANVALTDVEDRLTKCQELAKTLTGKYKTDPMATVMDLFHSDSINRAVDEVIARYGKIDILINNAAYNPISKDSQAPFEEYALEYWEKVIAVDLTGVFLCSQAVGKQMLKQGRGVIVNIGSTYGMAGADQRIYGSSGLNSAVSYAAAKGGVINLTRYMAAYWQGKNIRVNCVSPAGVYNPAVQNEEFLQNYMYKTMLGRMAAPSDLRGAMLFLCSDASDFMTGSNLVVDAGWTAW